MFFDIGQPIICIGGGPSKYPVDWWEEWAKEWGVVLPRRGRRYTVRGVRLANDGTQRVRLVEIVNPVVSFKDAPAQEPWWQSVSFRPIVKRETDIAMFRKLLVPHRELDSVP